MHHHCPCHRRRSLEPGGVVSARVLDIRDALQSAVFIVGKDVAKPFVSVALILLMFAIMARANTTPIPVITILLETPEAG
jgi:hypothetical protein